MLQSSHKGAKFQRGKTDEFVIEAIDIGEPRRLKLWTDGHGLGAGWHLDKAVVDVPLLGKTFTFPCGRWFAKVGRSSPLFFFCAWYILR